MELNEILLIVMFLCVVGGLMMGFPVAFVLSGVSLVFGLIVSWLFDFSRPLDLLTGIPQRILNIEQSQVLLAVPLFIFMGVMLERSKVAEELLDNMGKAFGPLRGGLAISVCIVGALLAASTGIVGATVVTMGLLSLPTMLARGYNRSLACGTISASGTLGQIIPPSIVLVLLGDQLSSAYQEALNSMNVFSGGSVSVNDLFAGAFFPGLLLVGIYILYIVTVSIVRPRAAPAIPSDVGQVLERWGTSRGILGISFLIAAGMLGLILLDIYGFTILNSGVAVMTGLFGLVLLFSMRLIPRMTPSFLVAIAAYALLLILHLAVQLPFEDIWRFLYIVLALVAFSAALYNGWRDVFWGPILRSLIPPLVLIIAVLGSILGGFASPTEAAAVGAVGAIMLAAFRLNPGKGRPILIGGAALVLVLGLSEGFDLRMSVSAVGTGNLVAFFVATVLVVILFVTIAIGVIRTLSYRIENGSDVVLDEDLASRWKMPAIFLGLLALSLLILAFKQLMLLGVLVIIVAALAIYAIVRSHTSGRARKDTVMTDVVRQTMEVTAMVFVILIGANVFSLVFRGFGGDVIIEEFLRGLPGGTVGAMLVVMVSMFVLGFFLDFLEITFIVVPVVAPVLLTMEFRGELMSPIWLGVMMAMNLQTSYLTPPFGFSLFYLRGVAPPEVKTTDIYKGIIPFVFIQLLSLVILWYWPELATWLPDLIFGPD